MGNYLAGEQGVAGGGGAGGSQEGVGGWTHADGSPRLRLSKKLPRFTRLRCLCLHGHGSNNDITQMQVDNLKLEEHHGVACDLFEAAHPCDAQDDIMPFFSRAPFRSWVGSGSWDLTRADAEEEEDMRASLVRSLREVAAVAREHGPYDLVYGFSLGACLATALCSRPVRESGLLLRLGEEGLATDVGELPSAAMPPLFRFVICACAGGSSLLRCPVPRLVASPASGSVAVASDDEEEGSSGGGGGGGGSDAKESTEKEPNDAEEVGGSEARSGGGAGVWTMTPLADAVEKIDKVGSLHIIGRRDPGKEDSEFVANMYARGDDDFGGGGGDSQRTIFHVPGGHEIPMPLRRDKALEDALDAFLNVVAAAQDWNPRLLRPSDNKVTPEAPDGGGSYWKFDA